MSEIVYDDGLACIAVALIQRDKDKAIALRWNASFTGVNPKTGEQIEYVSLMGRETEWFILPFDFAVGVARKLIELQVTGHDAIRKAGFEKMLAWLVDYEAISDAMCY